MQRALLITSLALFACGGAGDDWKSVGSTPAVPVVMDVWAFSETDVWFVDGSPTVHRYDGTEFSTIETSSATGLTCIFALSPTEVYLCADTGVLRYDGTSFSAMDVTPSTGLDGISSIWASSSDDVWAVGDDAIVARYDGSEWTRTLAGFTSNTSIWGSSPSDVYVLGTFELVHFDGNEWLEVSLDGGAGDGEVWGTGPSDVWVMAESSELSHFNGSSWETIETFDFIGELAAVWGPSSDDLWAVGTAGSIAHYDGNSWDEVAHQRIGAPYLRLFLSVHGTSSSDVWAVGQQLGEGGSTGLIYHYEP